MDTLVACFILPFCVKWLCAGERKWSQKQGVVLCVFLVVLLHYKDLISWRKPTLYDALGVSTDAEKIEIASAYRDLSLRFHPDLNPEGEERFKQIAAAYEFLQKKPNREFYGRFGDLKINNTEEPNVFEVLVLAILGQTAPLMISGLTSVFLGPSKQRNVFSYCLVGFACIETQIRLLPGGAVFSNVPYLQNLLRFQLAHLMRSVSPMLLSVLVYVGPAKDKAFGVFSEEQAMMEAEHVVSYVALQNNLICDEIIKISQTQKAFPALSRSEMFTIKLCERTSAFVRDRAAKMMEFDRKKRFAFMGFFGMWILWDASRSTARS